ncbi:unnamed protein product [Owenia fusiformis]|uniref:Uncharacterized protein n=1 Tax=Owenia fusiformis TaxID=6347 RepID=A0A8J1UPP5_OWEFU|nr:unnamed protein product [Owenia fusiformis]
MYMLILLFALAYGQIEEAIDVFPEECVADGGYIDGQSKGGDCCSFFVCDGATNKTAYKGSCMGGTAWNDELKVCDEPKYVDGCTPAEDCIVPSRTTEECGGLGNSECCVAGRKPVYTMISDTEYRREGDIKNNVCPPGEVFSLSDCCCEPNEPRVAPCTDPKLNYFSNDGDCCTYLQCYANGTGTDIVACMPPSVWNDAIKSCDLPFNVMACMDVVCGAETTNYACTSGTGCCRDGIWYSSVGGNQYVINSVESEAERAWENDPERALCCEDDMNGVPQVFNDLPEICCCEPAAGEP